MNSPIPHTPAYVNPSDMLVNQSKFKFFFKEGIDMLKNESVRFTLAQFGEIIKAASTNNMIYEYP